ncbi:uncharacterized protein CC84DRAFT_1171384 [Paraphaeosphaeria sporulosa]|uniref:Uncharacterized protein n=1 Tax=Paraphaeosphaeria sporulosa TaxID=1460663 RepID=A0A177CYX9_9PLEO|nr:uncharacterized protein CC84DRAFT_1171384 [Paraphaeosphaeria sporulosa]OAG12713.1 hypothetical protein CC84DRAFT_1171384 [Paraphaeosphaeria sporulosa]
MFASETAVWELGEHREWVRRDYQAEERLGLDKEEYDRETQRLKQEYEEWETECKRMEMEKAAGEVDRAWEKEVMEFQDDVDALEFAFLGKQDRRRKNGARGRKRPSKQSRVRVYHGAAKGVCKCIRAYDSSANTPTMSSYSTNDAYLFVGCGYTIVVAKAWGCMSQPNDQSFLLLENTSAVCPTACFSAYLSVPSTFACIVTTIGVSSVERTLKQ